MKKGLYLGMALAGLLACQPASTPSNPNARVGATTPTSTEKMTTSPLNDIWALREINGKTVTKADYARQIPYIEINLKNGRVMGTGGCNRLAGPVKVTDETITFGPLMSTKMACPTGLDFEASFLKALESVDTYQLDKLKLTLYHGKDEVLVLAKVD